MLNKAFAVALAVAALAAWQGGFLGFPIPAGAVVEVQDSGTGTLRAVAYLLDA